MAYEVTATRRRPQKFNELVGQEFVASTLQNSITSGKVAHAYLFSGPRGCGKTSTARILAKVLNCEKGPEQAPCGECSACREIARGASMDVIEIDGASNTSVNDVRQIKDEILFPPNSCKYKIYIIDEVHMLSTPAFNALLKTIEEPPPYVIFIFATTELHKVPATIKSRCQQFHFRLGSIDQIKELLAKAAEEIGVQADDEALYWIARESTGSFRDAYTLFDQVVSFSDGHITYDKIRDKLGLVGTDRLNELCELCCDGNLGAVFMKLDEYLAAGVSIEQLITNLTDYLRSLLLIQNNVMKESLLGQSADRFSKKVLENWDSVRLERGISLLLQLYRDIRYSLSPRFELEAALSKLCWLSKYVSAVEVKAAIDAARGLLSGAPAGAPQALPAQAASSAIKPGIPVLTAAPQGSAPAFSAQTPPAPQPAQPARAPQYGRPPIPNLVDTLGSSAPQEPRPFPDGGDRLAPVTPVQKEAPSASPVLAATAPVTAAPASPASTAGSAAQPAFSSRQAAPAATVQAADVAVTAPAATAPAQTAPASEPPAQLVPQFPADDAEMQQMPPVSAAPAAPATTPAAAVARRDISVEQLRSELIEQLRDSKPLLASTLMNTDPWQLDNNNLTIQVDTALKDKQIKSELRDICLTAKSLTGLDLQIFTQIKKPLVDEEVILPDEIKSVCTVFNGKLIQIKDRTASDIHGQPPQNDDAAGDSGSDTGIETDSLIMIEGDDNDEY